MMLKPGLIAIWITLGPLFVFSQKVSGPVTPSAEKTSRTLAEFPAGLFFYEGFDNAPVPGLPQGWTTFSIAEKAFVTGTGGTAPGQANGNGFWPVPLHGFFVMTNDDDCSNCDKSADILASGNFDLSAKAFVRLGFSAFQNGSAGQTAALQVRTLNEPWTTLLNIPASALWEDYQVTVPGVFLEQGFQFRFRYSDNNAYASGLAVDDIYMADQPTGRFYMEDFYTVNGNEEASGYLYHFIAASQARYADFIFGADAVNEDTTRKNARLRVEVEGPLTFLDSTANWYVAPVSDTNVRFPIRTRFAPYQSGSYTLKAELQTDSVDEDPLDNSATVTFSVHDSLYQRIDANPDGTGIWVLNTTDRVGVVYNIYRTDTVEAVKLKIHPASVAGSRFRVKVFHFDTLTASLYSTTPIILEEEDVGAEMRIPLKKELTSGKYLFVIEKETGTIVIASNAKQKAPEGVVLAQNSGQGWRHFPYYPLLTLVMPEIDPDCPGHIRSTVEDQSCPGVWDGSIFTDLVHGVPPFTYNWSNAAGDVSFQTDLFPGTFRVTITDSTNCVYERGFRVRRADTLQIFPEITDDSCAKGIGVVDLHLQGGARPLNITWNGEPDIDKKSGLSMGMYSIMVEDQFGCTLDTVLEVGGTEELNAVLLVTRSGCGNSNGKVVPVVFGTPPFNYEWQSGPLTDTLDSVPSGIYHLKVTDSIGCEFHVSALVNDSGAANISVTSKEDIHCYGIADGSIGITATGGNAPYDYQWSNGGATAEINNLTAGEYFVTVTDDTGCKSFSRANIKNESTPLLTDLIENGINCFGNETGYLEVLANGGDPGYEYTWSNELDTEFINELSEGEYTVTVRDEQGCEAVMATTITSRPAFFLHVDSIRADTGGSVAPEAAIYITTYGGTPPYSFHWNNGSTKEDLTGVDTGFFELTVRDQLGCELVYSKVLTDDPLGTEKTLPVQKPDIDVYPVPGVTGAPIIVSSDLPIDRVRVYDASGRIVNVYGPSASFGTRVQVYISSNGLYVLEVGLKNGQVGHRKLTVGN